MNPANHRGTLDMIRHLPLKSFVVLITSIVLTSCGGGTSGTGMNTYEGRVGYDNGAPIEGATLTVESTGDSTTTNANGEFAVNSKAFGPEVAILAETSSFSERITVRNVFEEHSRIRVDVTIDSIRQHASTTDFNVKAQFVGLCDVYFENRAIIRQANHVPQGTVCTLRVDLLADGERLDGATIALQYATCEPNSRWETLQTSQTGIEGPGEAKISFEYKSSKEFCRYRIVAPFRLGNAWPIYYPIDTFAEQASRK